MFDDFNSQQNSNISERDRLEIDNNGKKRGESQQEKRMENMRSNPYGNNNSSKNRGLRGNSGGSRWYSFVIIFAIVGVLIYLPIAYSNGTLANPLRSIVSGTAKENTDSFFNSIMKFKKEGDIAYENKWSDSYDEATEKTFYDVNPLFMSEYLFTQVEPEYAVIVYTGDDDLDAPFIEWIEKYEAETSKSKLFKIYRMPLDIAVEDMYVEEALTDENYNIIENPLVLIFNTPTKGKKVLDSIITNPEHLSKFPEYMQGLLLDK